MLAARLKRLANAAETAKLDLNPRGLTLAQVGDDLLAWYQGHYAACGITTPAPDTLSRPVSVTSAEFRDLVGLFDDEMDVRLTPGGSALTLSAGQRRVSLQYKDSPDYEGYASLVAVDPAVDVDLAAFKREADLASNVASVALTSPILTGTRVITSGTLMGVSAANGTSLLLEAFIDARPNGRQKLDLVAPAGDLLTGLRMLEGSTLSIASLPNAILLRGDDAVVKLPLLSGKWPSMDSLKPKVFADHISLPVPIVRALAIAVRAYRASNDAIIRPTESGAIVLETRDSEMGQFQQIIPGVVSKRYVVDVADLDVAAKISEDAVDMLFSHVRALVSANNRKLYVTLRPS